MSTYIRGGASNFGDINEVDLTLQGVQVDTVGHTIFVAYHYRNNPASALVSTPTWNGETFTELVNEGNIPGDDQHVLQVFYLTTASTGTFPILATNNDSVANAAVWAVYSGVTSVTPIEIEEQWFASGYTNPSLTIAGDGTVLNILGAANYTDGFGNATATTWSAADGQTVRQSIQQTSATGGWAILADVESTTSQTVGFTPSALQPGYVHTAILIGSGTPSATATLDDENLTYGADFTGTFANMDPVPTSLTISDGTRSATVAITTDAGTFAGTMPALPAAGAEQAAGSQVYPGDVTMTVGGVEIETTLALEASDDSIIVGASPVYTAYDDMGWTEAQRPATGDCLVWDDQAGEIEFFADLTVDVNVEVTDGYLCIIRADGAAEANAFRSTGISEIGAVDPEPPAVGVLRFRKPRVDKPSGRRPTVRQP